MTKTVKRVIWGVVIVAVLGAGWFYVPPIWHILHGTGVLESHPNRTYQASNVGNLKALYTAMMKYHETEGQFPDAKKWMDELKSRIRADDMSKSESAKKFVNPMFASKAGVYGYAMNQIAGGKYKGDLNGKTPLIFDSDETAWDACGDPKKIMVKNGKAITVDGTIIGFDQLP